MSITSGTDRASAGRDVTPPVPLLEARALLGPAGIARIEHEGQVYILRLTRNNRLILTK